MTGCVISPYGPTQSAARRRDAAARAPAGLLVGLVLGMGYSVFFIEALGIWTFGTYWLVKSRELALSRLEKDPDHAVVHANERKSTGQLAS